MKDDIIDLAKRCTLLKDVEVIATNTTVEVNPNNCKICNRGPILYGKNLCSDCSRKEVK